MAALILFGAVFELSAIPPKPDRLVNDLAGCMPAYVADSLERALVAFDDSTSNQICVLTVPTLDGLSSSEYAVLIFNRWGIGDKSNNNGVLILVKPKTESEYGDVWITTGYGLEAALNDVVCHRIVSKIMIPRFKKDDYAGAITEACRTVMEIASGEFDGSELEDDGGPSLGGVLAGIAVIAILIALFVFLVYMAANENNDDNFPPGGGGSNHNRPYRRTRWVVGPGSFGGGSSSGGFGGGFGGFGGGLSGGGGAGGRW